MDPKHKKVLETRPPDTKHHRKIVLTLGDSIMRQQIGIIQPYAEVGFISDWLHSQHLFKKVIPNPSKIRSKFDAIYLNFGSLHLTHLHPKARGWGLLAMQVAYFLEDLIAPDIEKYKKIAKKVVILTPPKVCENQFYKSWRYYVSDIEANLKNGCAPYVMKQANAIMKWGKQLKLNSTFGTLHRPEVAYEFCKNHTMTANGTEVLAQRMRNIALTHNLSYVDYFNWTSAFGCGFVSDGRHYNDTMLAAVTETVTRMLEI